MIAITILLILIIVISFILLIQVSGKSAKQQHTLKEVNQKLTIVLQQLEELQEKQYQQEKKETKIGIAGQETQQAAQEVISIIPGIPPVVKKEENPVSAVAAFSPAQISVLHETDDRKYSEETTLNNRKADLEKFIGENLANKIGIAVLVLGISFFVKYAIDKNWINETGRVIIGLACGAILIAMANYMRRTYRSFSSVLVGGGLTIFYFTIAFAFHEYHLFSQQMAFIIMIAITAFAVLLALYYNRQELAVLATIGGFITPFLLVTGQENHIALFTYLCILNCGLLALSWFKRWPVINIIALFFTTIIYGGWLVKRMVFTEAETLPYKDALFFATIFYLLFITMNITNNLRNQRKFGSFDFIVVLSINFLYYASAMLILPYFGENLKGIYTALLGIVNLVLAAVFHHRKNIDNNFTSLLIGLAISFISLTGPVQFDGNHIVLFWAAESVVLFWLYQRSRIVHLKIAAITVSILMGASLLLTWSQVYFSNHALIPVILNKGFITTLAATCALFIFYMLLRKEKQEFFLRGVSGMGIKNTMQSFAIGIAYMAGLLEIFYQFDTRFPEWRVYIVYIQAYSFAIAVLLLQIFKHGMNSPKLKFWLTAACMGIYLFYMNQNDHVSLELLIAGKGILFAGHWIATLLLLWLLYGLARFFFISGNAPWPIYKPVFTWLAIISIILVLSIELYHVILWSNYHNETDWVWWQNLYYKAGLTILWSICSFIMMWLGMKFSFRILRLISLSLFSLTLVKLFSYDIRNIPPGGKIAAFILLGILLLIVSFMYQRLKKIIAGNPGA